MITQPFAAVTIAATLALAFSASSASADPADDAARADASFKEAMQLRSAGQDAQACPKFAESRQWAPAVGVTLYLADCYERTGRTASAWREFRTAEKLARERNDKRAEIASQRAAALEPKLYRLTVAVPPAATGSGAEVQVDGAPLTTDSLNVALAVDPGDHVVTVASAGQSAQTFHAHVDAQNPSATVRVEEPTAPPAPPLAAATVPVPDESSTPASGAPTGEAGSEAGARWGAAGLIVAGGAGVGIGAWLVTSKTREMENGQLCDPHLRPHAIPLAAVAFSAGGVALISGVTLYYFHRPGRNEVSLGPTAVPGGAGAFLRTTF